MVTQAPDQGQRNFNFRGCYYESIACTKEEVPIIPNNLCEEEQCRHASHVKILFYYTQTNMSYLQCFPHGILA